MATWTNISAYAVDAKFGYQGLNNVLSNAEVDLYTRPWRPISDASSWLQWKGSTTITLKAGYYFVGDSLLTLASDLDWTWTASGHNKGVISGDAASQTAPYYLYAINDGGACGIISSLTAPTARFNTDLPGSLWDTNTYLGSFYNFSGILEFLQTKNRILYRGAHLQSWSPSLTYARIHDGGILYGIPATAVYGYWKLTFGVTGYAQPAQYYFSHDGTNDYWFSSSNDPTTTHKGYGSCFWAPFSTPSMAYSKYVGMYSTDTFPWAVKGYLDKFLI